MTSEYLVLIGPYTGAGCYKYSRSTHQERALPRVTRLIDTQSLLWLCVIDTSNSYDVSMIQVTRINDQVTRINDQVTRINDTSNLYQWYK